MQTESTDVLVIGAGPSGTVAASLIHQAGFSVRIIEKMKFPRFVIGESLLPRCMEALDEAKFLDALSKRGYQEKNGAKFVRDGRVCDFQFADQYTKGWTQTWQVPRADFDNTLAQTVEQMGVTVQYETAVTGIQFNDDGSSVTTVEDTQGNKQYIKARFIVDGSGYGRVIPRLLNLERPSTLPSRKTLFAHTVDKRRAMSDEPNRITIVVHRDDVWIWVIPFSNGVTSLGFVGFPEFFEEFEGSPEEKYRALIASEPYLRERFKDVELVFEPRVLQSWSKTVDKFYGNGFVLTGNATEFLDPVFSSGVTLAVVSSQVAAKLVIRQLNGEKVDWEKEYTAVMMEGVEVFRSYILAWYDGTLGTIFFAENQEAEIKNQICSVLAGYVWDTSNPFIKEHQTALQKLARVIKAKKIIDEK